MLTMYIGSTTYYRNGKKTAINVSFDEEYDEKTDSTPVRRKNIHQDEKGEYILHKSRRYYLKDYL